MNIPSYCKFVIHLSQYQCSVSFSFISCSLFSFPIPDTIISTMLFNCYLVLYELGTALLLFSCSHKPTCSFKMFWSFCWNIIGIRQIRHLDIAMVFLCLSLLCGFISYFIFMFWRCVFFITCLPSNGI